MLLKVGPHIAEFSSWGFTNIYFLDNMTDNNPQPNLHKEVPSSLHIMNHVYRYSKCTNARSTHHQKNSKEHQLHTTWPLYQVLPQHRPCHCSSQPFPQSLHWYKKSSLLSLFHSQTNKSFTRERPNQVLCMSTKTV